MTSDNSAGQPIDPRTGPRSRHESSDRLAEIEKRQDRLVAYYDEDAFPDAQDDIDWLIDEVKRLRESSDHLQLARRSEPLDIRQLVNRVEAAEEPPVRPLGSVTRFVHDVASAYVEAALREHLRKHHGLGDDADYRVVARIVIERGDRA